MERCHWSVFLSILSLFCLLSHLVSFIPSSTTYMSAHFLLHVFPFGDNEVSWLSLILVVVALILIWFARLPRSVLEVSKKMLIESNRNPVAATVEKQAGWFLLSSLLASLPREVNSDLPYVPNNLNWNKSYTLFNFLSYLLYSCLSSLIIFYSSYDYICICFTYMYRNS